MILARLDAEASHCHARSCITRFQSSTSLLESAPGVFQLETLSPFAGPGMLVGMASHEVDASTDNLDNNRNGQIDEPEETYLKSEFSAVLYPEIGVAW